MKKNNDLYNAEYTYDNSHLLIEKFKYEYPIIERSNNGLLFPEGPKNNVDMNDIED